MVAYQPENERTVSSDDKAEMPAEDLGPSVPELAASVEFDYHLIQETELSPAFRGVLEQFDVRTEEGGELWKQSVPDIVERTQHIFFDRPGKAKATDEFAQRLNTDLGDLAGQFVCELNARLVGEAVASAEETAKLDLFDQLALIEAIEPEGLRVDTAAVLGATAPAIAHRTDLLAGWWNDGQIEAKEVLLVGGVRKGLAPDAKWLMEYYGMELSDDARMQRVREASAFAQAVDDADLPFITLDETKPPDQRVRFSEPGFAKWYIDNASKVSCPDVWKGSDGIAQPGSMKEPEGGKITTESTMAGIDTPGDPKDVIVVSSQPHVTRQGADSLYTLLDSGWKLKSFAAIGPAKSSATAPRAILVELVKQLRGEARLLGLVE